MFDVFRVIRNADVGASYSAGNVMPSIEQSVGRTDCQVKSGGYDKDYLYVYYVSGYIECTTR